MMQIKKWLDRGTRDHYQDPLLYSYLYKRRKSDLLFYLRMAQKWGGPILELGCGNGRMTVPLLGKGYKITAVDSHPQMLADLRRRVETEAVTTHKGELKIIQADLRTLQLDERFAFICAPFNVFNHLYSLDEIKQALGLCLKHLKKEGRLVFDVRMPDLWGLSRPDDKFYKLGEIYHPRLGKKFPYRERFAYDPISQIQMVTQRFEEKNGKILEERILTHRHFFPEELKALLHFTGFEIEAIYGGFNEEPLDADSLSQVVIARR